MRKLLLIFTILLNSSVVFSQGTFFRSADFPGAERKNCYAETVGHKGYLMLGVIAGGIQLNEVWEYDELSGVWTQKNNFPGPTRLEAFTFSVNGNIYLGCGYNGAVCYTDVWKYTPATDSWVQVAYFPGTNRDQYASFSYNGKGYIAFGRVSCTNNSGTDEFWEYDPVGDQWTQLTSAPDPIPWSRAAVVNDKVYFLNETSTLVYVYDFATSSWDASWPAAPGPATSVPLFGCNINGVPHIFNQNYPKFLHIPGRTWLRGDTMYNTNWHQDMTFMAFADTVKIIGGSTGVSAFSAEVWSFYPGCTSNLDVQLTAPDTSYFGGAADLINASTVTPAGNTYAWQWQVDTVISGWFAGDTVLTPAHYGLYHVSLLGTNGYCIDSTSDSVYVNRGMWSGKTVLPAEGKERSFAVAAVVGNDAFIGMGIDVNGSVLRDMWKYNTVTQRLTHLNDFPFPALKYPSFVQANSKCYLLGGDPGISPYKSNKFYEYDPTTDTWTALPDFPGPARVAAKAIELNSEIYLFFGGDTSAYKYNPAGASWTRLTPHPSINYADAVVEDRGNILSVVLGSSSSVWQYNVVSNVWGQMTTNFAKDARFGSTIYMVNGKLWIVNGKFSGTSLTSYLNSSYFYQLSNGAISPGPSSYIFSNIYQECAFGTGFEANGKYYRCFGESGGGYKDKTIGCFEPNACENIPYFYPYGIDEAGIGIEHNYANSSKHYLPPDTIGSTLFVDGVVAQANVNTFTAGQIFEHCGEHKLQWVISRAGCSDTTTYWQTAHPIYRLEPRSDIPMGSLNIRHTMNATNIGNTGYMGMGNKYVDILVEAYKDWYAYDPATDSWTVKASLPAGAENHTGSATFSDATNAFLSGGTKGCFGSNACFLTDTWQYDPVLDTWTQKSNLPGVGRYNPVAAVIGDTAYVGLGYYSFSGGGQIDKYHIPSDSWTSSGWPYGASMSSSAISFAYGNKVYAGYNTLFGGGANPGLYAYDQSTGAWSASVLNVGQLNGERYAKVAGNEAFIFNEFVSKIDLDRMKVIPLQSLEVPGDTSNEFSAAFSINNQVYISLLNLDFGSPRLGNHVYKYDLNQPVCDLDSLFLNSPELSDRIQQLNVTPNPAHGKVFVSVDGKLYSSGNYQLFDMQGRVVMSGTFSGKQMELDLSKHEAGMYTLLYSEKSSGKIYSGKVVVN
ncbi:MAG: T9SS type A sorting domain-containing protein [Bacteroidia bacterium]